MKKLRLITAFMLCVTMLCASGCAEKNAEGAQVTEDTEAVTYESIIAEEIAEKSETTTEPAVVTTESETQSVTTTTQAETTTTAKQSIEELFADGIEINGKKYAIPMYMEDFGEGYSWSSNEFMPDLKFNGKSIASVSLKDETSEILELMLLPEYEYKYGEIYAGNTKENVEAAYGKPEDGYELMGIGSANYRFGNSYVTIIYQDDILLAVKFCLNTIPEQPIFETPLFGEKSFSIKDDVMTSVYINGVKLPANINDMPEELALKNDPLTLTENGRDMTTDIILYDGQTVGTISYYVDNGEIMSFSVDNITNNAEIEVYGISMGDSPEKVIEILGEPDEKTDDNTDFFMYMEDDFSTLLVIFVDNKVAMVTAAAA